MVRRNFKRDANPDKLELRKYLHTYYEVIPVAYSVFAIRLPQPCRSHSVSIVLLLLITGCAVACTKGPKTEPTTYTLTDAEILGLNGDASTDVNAVSNRGKTVNSLLQAGRYEQLDDLADAARSRKEKFAGGMWKIHAFYGGLDKPPLHATEEDWKNHLEMLQRWVSARPDSITARVALAESYVNYGWEARGGGFADTVSESGWKLFEERPAKAKKILEEASSLPDKDPEWYLAMQYVALAQGWDPSAKEALLEKAIQFEPGYYYYRTYADSILPKWGGEEGEVARFLEKAADQVGGDAGDILYFRVANYVICGCQTDQKLNLSWPRIRRGFDAVEKQYGTSMENLNQIAHMAGDFNDAVVADKAFTRIGDQWSEDLWKTSENFESAKQLAKQMAPFIARQQAAEESAESNLHTVEGSSYNAGFAEKMRSWMRQCREALASKEVGTYEVLIKIGGEGTIDDFKGGGDSSLMPCLGEKIAEYRLSKKAAFAVPPKPDYWVRFDVSPENSASAALK